MYIKHNYVFTSVTTEMLNEYDSEGLTVWHVAAKHGTLKYIPKHYFTENAMNQQDLYKTTNSLASSSREKNFM